MLENLLEFADQVRRDMDLSDVDIVFTPYSLIIEKMPLGLGYVEVRGVASPEMNKVIIHYPKGANENGVKRTIVEELVHFYVPGHGDDFKQLYQAQLEQYGIIDSAKLYASILMTAVPVVVGFGLMASGSGVEKAIINTLSSVPKKGESTGYCLECLTKHGGTSKVLLREAMQRAVADGVSSEGVQEKVRDVVAEFGGAEYDSSSVASERIRALDKKMRVLRRKIQRSGLEVGRGTMEHLEKIKEEIDSFVDEVYEAAKLEITYGCPDCDALIEVVCKDVEGEERIECIKDIKEHYEGKKDIKDVLEKWHHDHAK